MNKYIVTGRSARFVDGVLELTAKQAERRAHQLEKLEGDLYRIIGRVEFKNGEVIGFDGVPSKLMQEVLEPEQPLEVKPLKKAKEVDVR